ncbi:MAG TPA: HAMP domain-containing sensor histidine kinase [Ilumatobacteraceae bacterium]|nr:HAMP domain-containing sensor histidine kinase [Ilumatobacteraceae bacterium]HRB03290.1 HAMP domain-containing sensor histidine kinase [Ilumatobacteraceae bacterium]
MSTATYQLTRWYLLDKREALADRQVMLNALVVKGQLGTATLQPADILETLQSNTQARAVMRVQDQWYSVVVELGESAVPQELVTLVDTKGAARQRVRVNGEPYFVFGIALPGRDAVYFEFISALEYERTLDVLSTVLFAAASITTIGGALAGWIVSRRVLRPLVTVAASARVISDGDLSHRLDVGGDPDLAPMAEAFNEMAGTVEARIDREHRFTADVSHELRTPLTAMGAAVNMANRSELTERGQYAMDILRQQLDQFTRLTLELLEIARIDSGVAVLDINDVDVAKVIEGVLAQASVEPSRLRVEPVRPCIVRLDGTRFERVMANLVENADRYAGGVVQVAVSLDANVLTVMVDDEGPGVPESERLAIFGRFNRGSMAQPEDKPKGTGLGLALVDEHVRMHGGRIEVVDAPSGGARFIVTIPGAP